MFYRASDSMFLSIDFVRVTNYCFFMITITITITINKNPNPQLPLTVGLRVTPEA